MSTFLLRTLLHFYVSTYFSFLHFYISTFLRLHISPPATANCDYPKPAQRCFTPITLTCQWPALYNDGDGGDSGEHGGDGGDVGGEKEEDISTFLHFCISAFLHSAFLHFYTYIYIYIFTFPSLGLPIFETLQRKRCLGENQTRT